MGWGSAVLIFDAVADEIIEQAKYGYCQEEAGTSILSKLIRHLRDGDWDTWHESFYRYSQHDWIRRAFENEISGIEEEI